uniref:DUF4218 domain-containing protein n=1 Tax=Nelumbo nucifera TaxID=4432 RepID=A0A822X8R9_NELNU|nr:TPA_asm: hypothetical protein HUJ06_019307 [Nelumbo nucifera]
MIRHLVDREAWKDFNKRYPNFAADKRNVKLELAIDEFEPHSALSSMNNIWPVMTMPYTLPPWMCMKPPYMMITLLISSPRGSGNDIGVYLQHLVKELQILWMKSVWTYDVVTVYKKLVQNRAHPKGSIVEGYLVEECMTFCSMYLHDVDTRFTRVGRNSKGDIELPLSGKGKPFGAQKIVKLDALLL